MAKDLQGFVSTTDSCLNYDFARYRPVTVAGQDAESADVSVSGDIGRESVVYVYIHHLLLSICAV
jgi:hypothetical protein